ncbi:MAG: alpha/beta hydrolase [Verrucomicrobiota bacterium]
MRRLRFSLQLFALASLTGCVALPEPSVAWRGSAVKEGYRVTRNLIYTPPGWSEAIPADFYQPETALPAPAVLLIHGGGWTGKDGRWQMDPIARQLVKRGYAVLNVTYRLAPKYLYPAPVEDMREALRWMREHASAEGIDAQRIAVFGYSAGGYLAAMAGYTEPPGSLRAVVAGGTPANLSLYPGGKLVPQFLGGTRDEIPNRFREASPVNHISENSPPTFIYHATDDKLVPREHAWDLIHGLEENQVPHEVYWIDGRGHVAAFLFPGDAINRSIDFLDSVMRK